MVDLMILMCFFKMLSEPHPNWLLYLPTACAMATSEMESQHLFCWYTDSKTNLTMEKQPFDDVSRIKNGDVPLTC